MHLKDSNTNYLICFVLLFRMVFPQNKLICLSIKLKLKETI